MKDIIQTHRGSIKGKSRSRSVKSNNSLGCSRDASPSDSIDAFPTTEASFLVFERVSMNCKTNKSP